LIESQAQKRNADEMLEKMIIKNRKLENKNKELTEIINNLTQNYEIVRASKPI